MLRVFDRVSIKLRIRVEKAEEDLREQEKMWKANNEDLLKQVEFMSKEEAEKEKEHDAEMANVIAKVKASIVIVV